MASAPVLGDEATGGRPRELEDRLNRFLYHPLAARLARLLRPTGISPNAVSVAGMLLIWGSAWAYTGMARPEGVILGFVLHLSWHVLDGADGDLARLKGVASPAGEVVDGACDYFGHILLYVALAAMLDDSIGGWSWALTAAAGASHAFQSNHAEAQRRSYLWWAYGRPWLKHAQRDGDAVFRGASLFSHTLGRLAWIYMKAANALAPFAGRVDEAVDAAAGDARRTARIRRLARRASRRGLLIQKLLGPNPRTIMLGASMAIGSPLYYFLAETVALNLLLVLSVLHHNRVALRLAEKLAPGSGRNG